MITSCKDYFINYWLFYYWPIA